MLLVVAFGLLLSIPLLLNGVPPVGDAWWHLTWQQRFAEQFWAGELYPRWLMGMNEGLGAPTFFTYGPLPFWVASLMRPLANLAPAPWKEALELGWADAVALLLSGMTAFIWLRRLTSPGPAVWAALAYMLLPYHLVVDLYFRSATPEFWAFAWMPLTLYFVAEIPEHPRRGTAGLAAAYALLLLTHLFVALIFSPVLLAYAWNRRAIVRVLPGLVLGAGLSAFYWLPALAHQAYFPIRLHNEQLGLTYDRAFLTSESRVPFLLASTGIALAAATLAFLKARRSGAESWLWIGTAAMATFLMLPVSKPVWQALPVLQGIQFPWRWNTVLCVATAALIALGIQAIAKQPVRRPLLLLALPVVLVYGVAFPLAGYREVYAAETGRTRQAAAVGDDNYVRFWSRSQLPKSALFELGRRHPPVAVVEGRAEVAVRRWAPRNILLEVRCATPSLLRVKQLYYPGWKARIGPGRELPVAWSRPEGLITVAVPPGSYTVALTLAPEWPERAGWLIAGVSAVLTLGLLLI